MGLLIKNVKLNAEAGHEQSGGGLVLSAAV